MNVVLNHYLKNVKTDHILIYRNGKYIEFKDTQHNFIHGITLNNRYTSLDAIGLNPKIKTITFIISNLNDLFLILKRFKGQNIIVKNENKNSNIELCGCELEWFHFDAMRNISIRSSNIKDIVGRSCLLLEFDESRIKEVSIDLIDRLIFHSDCYVDFLYGKYINLTHHVPKNEISIQTTFIRSYNYNGSLCNLDVDNFGQKMGSYIVEQLI